eukprot:jgi/Astpho2/8415/Aster-01467
MYTILLSIFMKVPHLLQNQRPLPQAPTNAIMMTGQGGNSRQVDLGPEARYKDVRCVKYERSASKVNRGPWCLTGDLCWVARSLDLFRKVLGFWSARCSVPGWSLR